MNKHAFAALALLSLAVSAQAAGRAPKPTPAPVETTLLSGTTFAGVEDIKFTVNSVVDSKFTLNLTGAAPSAVGFSLFSGTTLLSPTSPITVGASNLVADYANLTVGSIYTIRLSSPVGTAFKISSLDKGTVGTITAVPEAGTTVLSLAGLGVVGAVVARRRKTA
jgi:hypothetical protein